MSGELLRQGIRIPARRMLRQAGKEPVLPCREPTQHFPTVAVLAVHPALPVDPTYLVDGEDWQVFLDVDMLIVALQLTAQARRLGLELRVAHAPEFPTSERPYVGLAWVAAWDVSWPDVSTRFRLLCAAGVCSS